MLIVGRAVAGMGGSGLVNGALTILSTAAPKHKQPGKGTDFWKSAGCRVHADLAYEVLIGVMMGRMSSQDLMYPKRTVRRLTICFQLVRLPLSVDHCSEVLSLNTPLGDGVC